MRELLLGTPIVCWVIESLHKANFSITVVVGHEKELIEPLVKNNYPEITCIEQAVLNGSGGAVAQALENISDDFTDILIVNGDAPAISEETLKMLTTTHTIQSNYVTFVGSYAPHDVPNKGYGRIVKTSNTFEIIEARDSRHAHHADALSNMGIYFFKKEALTPALQWCIKKAQEGQREVYITDAIEFLSTHFPHNVQTVEIPFHEAAGINTLEELAIVEEHLLQKQIKTLMAHGVRFLNRYTTRVDKHVQIDAGTLIEQGVHLKNGTVIGKNCTIGAYSIIEQSTLADNVMVKPHSVISKSSIAPKSKIGPFAYLREQTVLETNVTIGSFVEVKNSTIEAETKAKHLSFLGDAQIGKQCNIGAGTITCNYNGKTKEKTIIEDNAFIGSNTSLVAPVTIGKNAYTAAGSVITNNVPSGALAFGRARQENKEGYAQKFQKNCAEADIKMATPLVSVTPHEHHEQT